MISLHASLAASAFRQGQHKRSPRAAITMARLLSLVAGLAAIVFTATTPAPADARNIALNTGLAAAQGATPATPVRPRKKALVVILENGGLVQNLDPKLKSQLNTSIPVFRCGNFQFRGESGDRPAQIIARYPRQIAANRQCVNPLNWRRETFRLIDYVNQQTDRMLEDVIKGSNALLKTQNRYDTVSVMEDANAIPSRVLAEMRRLAPSHVIDVHVLTHGTNNAFSGFNKAAFTQDSFFKHLSADRDAGKPMFIRAVYQMNCVSGTLMDDWEGVGAEAVNGTRAEYLNSMPWQYTHFMRSWITDQQSFDAATRTAYAQASGYTQPVFNILLMGRAVGESELVLSAKSNRGLKINH
ncbi:hypothetical protein [Sphingomonas sp.]